MFIGFSCVLLLVLIVMAGYVDSGFGAFGFVDGDTVVADNLIVQRTSNATVVALDPQVVCICPINLKPCQHLSCSGSVLPALIGLAVAGLPWQLVAVL